MITIRSDQNLVTLINAFSCEPKTQDDLVKAWQDATEIELGRLPGIISAALHRSLDGTRVDAQWRSVGDWENLTRLGKIKAISNGWAGMGSPTLICTRSFTRSTKRRAGVDKSDLRTLRAIRVAEVAGSPGSRLLPQQRRGWASKQPHLKPIEPGVVHGYQLGASGSQ
jgi:Flp pilus assembly pilin Flp